MSDRQFKLTIRAPKQATDDDAIRLLRLALKRMLRAMGWRCVEIAETGQVPKREEPKP